MKIYLKIVGKGFFRNEEKITEIGQKITEKSATKIIISKGKECRKKMKRKAHKHFFLPKNQT